MMNGYVPDIRKYFIRLLFPVTVTLNPMTAFSQGHEGHMMQPLTEEGGVTDSTDAKSPGQDQDVPMVEITPEQQQLIGVRTIKASVNPLVRVIRTVGRVEVNERNLATVNAKIDGWIERLYIDYTGAYIKKGEPLIEIYSPELLATQMEFINALGWSARHRDEFPTQEGGGGGDNATPGQETGSRLRMMLVEDAEGIIDAGRQRLRQWDMSEAQIAELEQTGKPLRTITLYSPAGGYITEKMAILGMKVMPGEKLFDIADLSSLWVIADIYEYELPFIQTGQEARITFSYEAGREYRARVDYIYPVVSEDTRTAKVRLTLSNKGGELKPRMFADVEIDVDMGNRLTIPESAVIDTGETQVVYVDLGDGNFEPREVRLGLRAGGQAEVLRGLKEGETVAYSANFLIDSEAQLRGVRPLGIE